jgi:hypothetical protein
MGQLGKRRYFNRFRLGRNRPPSMQLSGPPVLAAPTTNRIASVLNRSRERIPCRLLKPGIKSLNQNPDQFVDFCVDAINSMNYYDLRIVGHWQSASMKQKVRKILHKLVEILDRYIIYATYQHHP